MTSTLLIESSPEIASHWCYPKNDALGLDIQTITRKSTKKAWWVCSKKHIWDAVIGNVTRSPEILCPVCSGRRVVAGINDLATTHPSLASEWFEGNNKKVTQVSYGSSSETYTWLCGTGHRYKSRVRDRVRGQGCPFCYGRYPLKGVNTFASLKPELAAFWSDSAPYGPEDLTANAHKVAYLVCDSGHAWQAMAYSLSADSSCTKCTPVATSKREQYLQALLAKKSVEAVFNKRINITYANSTHLVADIFIPGPTPTIVEYDGAYWHKDLIERDTQKTEALLAAGYRVIRIREQKPDIKLPILLVQHKNLLQLAYKYDKNFTSLDSIVSSVNTWLPTKTEKL